MATKIITPADSLDAGRKKSFPVDASGMDYRPYACDKINKEVIAAVISKKHGNGSQDQKDVKELLEAVLEYVKANGDRASWGNAVLIVYSNDTKIVILSGSGQNKVQVQRNGKNQVVLTDFFVQASFIMTA